ncbi:MAG: hypothetical protein HYR51_17690 [Candidatus Rokubacteria bacterium]|nr:hypothetical protein [Candidatus Rokubacteria bacterium]
MLLAAATAEDLVADATRINDARTWRRLAETALDEADVAGADALRWYDIGQMAAERAIALEPGNADAQFLLAAHRGHIARRRLAAPWIVRDLEQRLRRALELDPRHARALHMMGRLLRDTPGPLRLLLNGSRSQSESYLCRAVQADPGYAEARLDLAEEYESMGRVRDARAQAAAVAAMKGSKHRPAAEALLKRLPPTEPGR